MGPVAVIDDLLRDLAYGVRNLRNNPGFTASVVSTLALGIGANGGIFSVVEAALLRPLPFPDPDRLVAIDSIKASSGPSHYTAVSPANLRDWSEQSTTMQVAGFSGGGMTLRDNDQVETVYAARITENFFDVLGVRPVLGRTFAADEWSVKGPRAVVLSHRLRLRRFGGHDVPAQDHDAEAQSCLAQTQHLFAEPQARLAEPERHFAEAQRDKGGVLEGKDMRQSENRIVRCENRHRLRP